MRACYVVALYVLVSAGSAEAAPLVADGAFGPGYLMKSRSHTPTHLFKPSLRLGLRGELGERLEVGGALVGVISASEHYRVLGALGQGRYAVVRTRAFSLGASAGVGLGYDADILHADLSAGAKVAPYWLMGIDGRWAIADRWLLGTEVAWQEAAVLQLGLIVGYRFDGGRP